MKHKISILVLLLLHTGCSVALRDREQPDENPDTELVVENEYTLPVPLVMSEQTVLRYDRLVLGRNAQFITQGLNVRIEVKELVSEGGTIRTFKSDQVAAAGINGRSGGSLELVIARARGDLQIVMQGEAGGKGIDGKEPDESLRGPKGAPGIPARFAKVGPLGGEEALVRRAENGYPGGQGLPGYSGGRGFKGGDSGQASIRVADAEESHITYLKNPGKGGPGGVGGAGGPGGYGGDPGRSAPQSYKGPPVTNYAVAGPQGPQGPQGITGETGINGYEEKICHQKGAEELQCE